MREKTKKNTTIEQKSDGKQKKFYTRPSEIKKSIVFISADDCTLYKEVFLNTNEFDHALPSSITSLLQEYGDVFLEEAPHGLPPIRMIEHQIDFMPGAAISNRPAYRSNLEETKELQRQVNELMEKRIRERNHESMCSSRFISF